MPTGHIANWFMLERDVCCHQAHELALNSNTDRTIIIRYDNDQQIEVVKLNMNDVMASEPLPSDSKLNVVAGWSAISPATKTNLTLQL